MSYTIQSIIIHNGEDVTGSVSGWSVDLDVDRAVTKWQIEFLSPRPVTKDDTFAIFRSYGAYQGPGGIPSSCQAYLATGDDATRMIALMMTGSSGGGGGGSCVIKDSHPDSWSDTVGPAQSGVVTTAGYPVQAGMTVSGTSGGQSGVGATQTLGIDTYFLATDYLNDLAPGGWQLNTDGCIYYHTPGASSYGPAQRVVGDGLPKPELPVGSFQCVIGKDSHLAISQWLANQIGADIISNCPTVTLRRAFNVPADKGVLQAIIDLNKLWQPAVSLKESARGTMTVYVLDSAAANPSTDNPIKLSLSAEAIEVVSFAEQDQATDPIVDHVIVKGAKDFNNTSLANYGTYLSPIEIPEMPLPENREKHWTDSPKSLIAKSIMGDYKGGFTKKNKPQNRSIRTEHSQFYFETPEDAANWILLREVVELYSETGLLQSTETIHKYGRGYLPINTITTEKMLCNVPGKPDKEMLTARRRIVDQSHYLDGLKQSMSQELIEEKVVANYVIPKDISIKPYWTTPTPLIQAQQQNKISTDPSTTQQIFEMKTKRRSTSVQRVTAGLLNQWILEEDYIMGTVKNTPQTIKDPQKPNSQRQQVQFVRDFYLGDSSKSKKTVTIEHPDIADETLAYQVAQRVFSRSSTPKTDITVRVLAPLSIGAAAFSVSIPEIPVNEVVMQAQIQRLLSAPSTTPTPILSTLSGGSTIAGGTFIGVGVRESLKASSPTNIDHSIELKLRSVL